MLMLPIIVIILTVGTGVVLLYLSAKNTKGYVRIWIDSLENIPKKGAEKNR